MDRQLCCLAFGVCVPDLPVSARTSGPCLPKPGLGCELICFIDQSGGVHWQYCGTAHNDAALTPAKVPQSQCRLLLDRGPKTRLVTMLFSSHCRPKRIGSRALPPEGNRVAPKFLKSFNTEGVRSSLSVCKCWLVLVRVRQILGTPVVPK